MEQPPRNNSDAEPPDDQTDNAATAAATATATTTVTTSVTAADTTNPSSSFTPLTGPATIDTALNLLPYPLAAAATRAVDSTSAPLITPAPTSIAPLSADDIPDITADLALHSLDLDLLLPDTQYFQLPEDPTVPSVGVDVDVDIGVGVGAVGDASDGDGQGDDVANIDTAVQLDIPDLFNTDAQQPLSPPQDPLQQQRHQQQEKHEQHEHQELQEQALHTDATPPSSPQHIIQQQHIPVPPTSTTTATTTTTCSFPEPEPDGAASTFSAHITESNLHSATPTLSTASTCIPLSTTPTKPSPAPSKPPATKSSKPSTPSTARRSRSSLPSKRQRSSRASQPTTTTPIKIAPRAITPTPTSRTEQDQRAPIAPGKPSVVAGVSVSHEGSPRFVPVAKSKSRKAEAKLTTLFPNSTKSSALQENSVAAVQTVATPVTVSSKQSTVVLSPHSGGQYQQHQEMQHQAEAPSYQVSAQTPLQQHQLQVGQLPLGLSSSATNLVSIIPNLYQVHPSLLSPPPISASPDVKALHAARMAIQQQQRQQPLAPPPQQQDSKHVFTVQDAATAAAVAAAAAALSQHTAAQYPKINTQHSMQPVVPNDPSVGRSITSHAGSTLRQTGGHSVVQQHMIPPNMQHVPPRVLYDPNLVPLLGLPHFSYPHLLASVPQGMTVPAATAGSHGLVTPMKADSLPITSASLPAAGGSASTEVAYTHGNVMNAPLTVSTEMGCVHETAKSASPTCGVSAGGNEGGVSANRGNTSSMGGQPVVVSVNGVQRFLPRQPAAKLDRHPVLGRLELKSAQKAVAAERGRKVSTAVSMEDTQEQTTADMVAPLDGSPGVGNDVPSTQNVVGMAKVEPMMTHGNVVEEGGRSGGNGNGNGSGSGNGGKRQGELRMSKKRLVWTPELHDRFVRAIDVVGLAQAVPKTLVTIMNVDGLTTEHVKSHLQKYRNSLRKEADDDAKAKMKAIDGKGNVTHGGRRDEGKKSEGVEVESGVGDSILKEGKVGSAGRTDGKDTSLSLTSGHGKAGGDSGSEDMGGKREARSGEVNTQDDDGGNSTRIRGGNKVEDARGRDKGGKREIGDGEGGEDGGTDTVASKESGGTKGEIQPDVELELMKEKTLKMQLQLQMMVHRTIALERKLQQEYDKRDGNKGGAKEKVGGGGEIDGGSEVVGKGEVLEDGVGGVKRKKGDVGNAVEDGRWKEKRRRREGGNGMSDGEGEGEGGGHQDGDAGNVQTKLTALQSEQLAMKMG